METPNRVLTRSAFTVAFRQARIILKTMSAGTYTMGRYANPTAESKHKAEAEWIFGINHPVKEPAFRAAADSCSLGGSIANAALYDLRYCGGHRRDWYLRMARDKRARECAA